MNATDIVRNLSSRLDSRCANELVNAYVRCRREFSREDWKSCLNEAGQFCEAAVAAAYQLVTQTSENPSGSVLDLNRIRFGEIVERLLKTPSKTAERESLCLVLPRTAQAVYSLRSKKRVAHLKTTELNFFDAAFAAQACSWLLSELIRISHTHGEQTIKACIKTLSKRDLPFVEVIDGDPVVLARRLSTLDQILLLLLLVPDSKMEEDKVVERLRHCRDVKKRIYDGDREGLLYRKCGIVHITTPGTVRIESKLHGLTN